MNDAMKYLEGLKDGQGNQLLVLERRRRPKQFRKSGTNWDSPKIRLDTDGQDLDFYTDEDSAQWPKWEAFLDDIVNNKPKHWQKQKRRGASKSKLIRINIATSETIEARCREFYNLFAEYDSFLDKQH